MHIFLNKENFDDRFRLDKLVLGSVNVKEALSGMAYSHWRSAKWNTIHNLYDTNCLTSIVVYPVSGENELKRLIDPI